MTLLSLQYSRAAQRADFVLYVAAVAWLALLLLLRGPAGKGGPVLLLVAAGLACWTAMEYLLHRFVLHGLPPFRGWHAQHHARPQALIGLPTVLSATLFTLLVAWPALALLQAWAAEALLLGVLLGYLAYGVTHHAVHHWPANNGWLRRRKREHALHHHGLRRPGGYGVTTSFWDRLFGTT